MKKKVDPETREIIDSFVAEAYERLDDAEIQLENLGGEDTTARLNAVFRLFHSVKGSAGFLEFENIKRLTHEAETLLDTFLKLKLAVDADSLDLILKTIDSLRSMVGIADRDNSDDAAEADAQTGASEVSIHVAKIKNSLGAPAAPPPEQEQPKAVGGPAEDSIVPPAPSPEEPLATSDENRIVLSELVTAEMVERFRAESADLLDEIEQKALRIPKPDTDGPEIVNEIFRIVHTIKGNAGFFGHALLEHYCMVLEGILDKARKKETPVNEALANSILEQVDRTRSAIAEVVVEGPRKTASRTRPPEGNAASEGQKAPRRKEAEYKPIGEILIDLGAVAEDEVRKALELQEKPLGEILVERGAAKPDDVERALEVQRATAGGTERAVEEIQRKEIRVDTSKLDKLFELVGELITAEAMVLNSPDLEGLKLDGFQKSFSNLNKISREIQETSMMIRMIPLEGLFHKMARLVRDLSRKFGKPVDFHSSGQETEMDKNVIEQVSDPLVHILRNSIDHGLEAPQARAAAGKPPAGSIDLSAKYEGSEIWISVRDDGAGLNRERILSKAVENGLVRGDPSALSDEEVWKFIFEPGFSTAKTVTEVSGRGVGMDVVKKNLDKIRGRVDVRTEKGKGTEFILKIPLTMVIMDGITLRSGSNFYSIPLGDIIEFFKAVPRQITLTERGESAVNLRGTILPLLKLGEVFRNSSAILNPLEGIVIVVKSADRLACLLIDEVVGNQQIVVKSMSEYLGKVEGISGCSILGDGRVSFIIDTGKLLGMRLE